MRYKNYPVQKYYLVLSELLLTTEEIYWLDTIAAIQERCNFYNHNLTQIYLTIEESADMPTVQTISVPKSVILHLSDLHFGTLADANNWYGTLADDLNDLSSELDFNQIDALIISGDVANRSTEEEYHAAEKFITQLAGEFRIKRSHIIIVPGNHDLNWDLGDKAYEKCRENGRLVLKCNPELHQDLTTSETYIKLSEWNLIPWSTNIKELCITCPS
ncbi:metallophosphoesterase family protein [Microseira wollei]|uniref:Calcineurin-like phosphoesterase domain-containing protein n=1 Tax=Microseira wollei NIES-4236 TaxID=2530354 RepID=A0AAV3XE15_9CYAN|nr:metallophosphoesterase [Microseira wollei]GET38684.1 hypothetical protein MiSe_34430 [Microseira wollei NIES-4236]